MKKLKWRIAAFVAWVVTTLIVVSVSLRGVSKADTATNLVFVLDDFDLRNEWFHFYE